jgi:hypothetical protein
MRYPGTVTVICVDDTALGKRTALPKLTTAPLWNVPPVIVNVNVPEPDTTDAGDRELIAGAVGALAAATVNWKTAEMPPPG